MSSIQVAATESGNKHKHTDKKNINLLTLAEAKRRYMQACQEGRRNKPLRKSSDKDKR